MIIINTESTAVGAVRIMAHGVNINEFSSEIANSANWVKLSGEFNSTSTTGPASGNCSIQQTRKKVAFIVTS
jgi:hypothetical protein